MKAENKDIKTFSDIPMHPLVLESEQATVDARMFELLRSDKVGLVSGEHINMNRHAFIHGCYNACPELWTETLR